MKHSEDPVPQAKRPRLLRPSTWDLPEQIQGILGLLSFLTFLVVVIGACFSYQSAKASQDSSKASQESARISAQELQMSERPWVSETVSLASPLTFDINGMNLVLDFKLQNSGHTPATSVFVYAEFVPPMPNHKASQEQKDRTCLKAMSAAVSSEATIFPGIEGKQTRKFRLSPAALTKASKAGYIVVSIATCTFYVGATNNRLGFKLGHIYDLRMASGARAIIAGEDVEREKLAISTPGENGTLTGPELYHQFPADPPTFDLGGVNNVQPVTSGPFESF